MTMQSLSEYDNTEIQFHGIDSCEQRANPFIGKTKKQQMKVMIAILKKEKYGNRFIYRNKMFRALTNLLGISKNK